VPSTARTFHTRSYAFYLRHVFHRLHSVLVFTPANIAQLFVVVGFGWAQDNLWPIATSLILPPIRLEFHPDRAPYLTLAQNIGLLVGAVFWGLAATSSAAAGLSMPR
jgi:hypothetical protein